jgi:hypothetical protein
VSTHQGVSEIFLSYAAVDRARVAPLVSALEAQGLRLWSDQDIEYGQNFHKVIEQALTAATCVIVVWTRESIQSEWVLNEASDARKRGRLLPVLLDPVTPPLEFRHLQAVDLSEWHGDSTDPLFTGLREGVETMIGLSDAPKPAAGAVARPRLWSTWPGRGISLGIFLIGVSALLLTLRHDAADRQAGTNSPMPDAGMAGENTAKSEPARAGTPSPSAPATAATEKLNLLDTEAGAQLLWTNKYQEQYWNRLFNPIPSIAPDIDTGGFAILSLRGDREVTFDTLAIFVDAPYVSIGVKDLVLFVSSASPEGPFAKVAQITVPDHVVLRKPFQEFHFPAVHGRYVKLQVLSSQTGGARAYVGSIRLYASAAR